MAFYQRRGKLPQKKHTQFYKSDETSLYREEMVTTEGFSGVYAAKYRVSAPTRVLKIEELPALPDMEWKDAPLQCRHILTDQKQTPGNFLTARNLFFSNAHVSISTAIVTETSDEFYKNAFAHELIFVHRGKGTFRSDYGILAIREGDYLLIPKGTVGQIQFDNLTKVKLFIVESMDPFKIPKHFRNDDGQLLEHAPYSERDFRTPEFVDPVDEKGDFNILIKAGQRLYRYTVDHHPFDVAGWDGCQYPFTFNIADYAPIVGKLHQPPPAHFVFDATHVVIYNFTPRLFDFHPQAIPVPYFHSNVDCDEVIYYVSGNFMSRAGIREGSITLHPMGVPHGPQPGKIEAAIGKKETIEYAVMVDVFAPLQLTTHVRDTEESAYFQSWL